MSLAYRHSARTEEGKPCSPNKGPAPRGTDHGILPLACPPPQGVLSATMLQDLKQEKPWSIPLGVSRIATLEDKSLIRAWREHLGLTQEEVASRMGVTRAAYTQMEAADAKPRRATLVKIATALGVIVEQLTE